MQKLLNQLERVAIFIASLALMVMMLHVSFDVIGKFFFNTPLPLTMEMATYYYMTALVFLPLAALERNDSSLVHVELLYDHLSRRLKTVVLPLALSLAALYCACASWAAWKPALKAMRSGSYAGSEIILSIWPSRFLPTIGFALLALALLLKTVLILRRGLNAVDGAEDIPAMIHEKG